MTVFDTEPTYQLSSTTQRKSILYIARPFCLFNIIMDILGRQLLGSWYHLGKLSYATYYDFELFCLLVRFSTGCRARSPGKSGRGTAPGSSVHYPAVPSDARRRGAAGSAGKAARTGSISRGRFFHHPRHLRREGIVFLRRGHDPDTSDSMTSCSSSSSSSAQSMLQPTVYNVTTLPRPAAAGNTMRV